MKKTALIAMLSILFICLFSAFADITYTLKLSATSITLAPGDSRTITWSVEPVNLVEHRVTWTSDNNYVATVDQRGKITAHASGSTYVRATLETGTVRRITVTVTGHPVTTLKLDQSTVQMEIGESTLLTYQMNADADDKRVKWTSDDPSVAKVDNKGNVTAVGGGVATITLLSVNGMTDTAVIYVPSDVQSVVLSKEYAEIGIGRQFTVEAGVLPINARNRLLTWESSDPNVATVDADGKVTGVGAGTCKIGARSENGKYAVMEVKVVILPESIMLTPDKLILTSENRNATLSVQILPAEAAETGIEWFSSNEAVVTVESGFLTAKGYGSAIVTAKTINDLFAEALVYVGESPLSVRLNNGVYLLPLGGEGIRVYPIFTPAESITLDYTMEVEDPSVASVDENGLLTARKIGTTSITLTTGEGLSCTSEIRVYEDVKSLFTNDDKLTIKQYEMRGISFYSETGRTFTGQLSARSDDENVCVYAGGCLLGKKPGSTVLTFTNPGTSAVCTVNVTVVENRDYPTRVLALTFDNGPDEHTREILNVLDKYGIKATFFLLGRNIELSPALAALYKDTEHELGNHTYDNSSIASQSVAQTASSLQKTDELAKRTIGREPTLLRAPDALLPEKVLSSFLDARRFVGRGFVINDISSQRSAEEISQEALSKVYNTCVLTFHDAGAVTAEALDLLLPELLRQGYRFLTVSELIDYTGLSTGIFSTMP